MNVFFEIVCQVFNFKKTPSGVVNGQEKVFVQNS